MKKGDKSINNSDTIGGIVFIKEHSLTIGTSSGGPWLKSPGRVGSVS